MDEELEVITVCGVCSTKINTTHLPPFTKISCSNCKNVIRTNCHFKQYILNRQIGKGGMSVVYAATDKQLNRDVAIKVLNDSYSLDDKRIEQFEQEALITASISHPNVVRVYTVGQAFERYFIAMELINGLSLEDYLKKKISISEESLMTWMIQVVSGLRTAHEAGLVHRDLKPGNILIDSFENAKIVDFGLALFTSNGYVQSDEVWATPYYAPPEALRQEKEDFRSDIYALCSTMYHLLAEQAPFKTKTRESSELLAKKKSIPSLKKLDLGYSDLTCYIIDTGMAYKPEDRFSSYEEMYELLQISKDNKDDKNHDLISTLIHKKKNISQSLPPTYTDPDDVSSNKPYVIVFSLVTLLLLIGAGYFLSQQKTPDVENLNSKPTPEFKGIKEFTEVQEDQLLRREIDALYQKKYDFLREEYYIEMNRASSELLNMDEHPEPSASIAGINGLMAALLAGDKEAYLETEAEIISHITELGVSDVDHTISLLKRFIKEKELPEKSHFENDEENNVTLLIHLIHAFKCMHSNAWTEGIESLTFFTESEFEDTSRNSDIYSFYRVMAKDIIEDNILLNNRVPEEIKKLDDDELEFSKERVMAFEERHTNLIWGKRKHNLLTPILEEIKHRQEQVLKQAELEKKNARVEQKRILELEKEEQRKKTCLERASKEIKERYFNKALEILEEHTFTDEKKEEQRKNLAAICAMADNYHKSLVNYLKEKPIDFKLKDNAGEEFAIERVVASGVIIEKGEAKVKLGWREISPQSIVKMYALVKEELYVVEEAELETIQVLRYVASYSYLTWQKHFTEQVLTVMVESDPVFVEKWKDVTESLDFLVER